MRTVPTAIRAAALAARTTEVTLAFLDIAHADLAATLRLVNNMVAVTKGGNSYSPCAFSIVLPTDRDGEDGTAQLVVDAVDLSIITAIRTIETPAAITVTIALASAPDTTEVSYGTFLWRPVSWTKSAVSGELAYDDVLDILLPGDCFTPVNVPGNF